MNAPLSLPAGFDPAQTLDCGQAFLWRPAPVPPSSSPSACDSSADALCWEGTAGGRYLRLRLEGDRLLLDCSREEFDSFWRSYFDFDEDYDAMRAALSAMSPALREAADFAPGIRILRQDPWEALCSFLISQNNNIPRIKNILRTLCALFGDPIPGTDFFSFPGPETLARLTVQDLEPLHAGYRARYLIDAARRVSSGQTDLEAVKSSSAAQGREELKKIMGVGPKVAECVLLYGFHKTECFPMDVWMKRAMSLLLPGMGPDAFGAAAGLAQQYLFYYSRLHPELFREAASR